MLRTELESLGTNNKTTDLCPTSKTEIPSCSQIANVTTKEADTFCIEQTTPFHVMTDFLQFINIYTIYSQS